MPRPMSTALPPRHPAVLLGLALLLPAAVAAPAFAQTSTPAAVPATATPPTATVPPASAVVSAAADPVSGPAGTPVSQADLQTALGKDKAGRIEAHIERLHADLKINASQEAAWHSFAATMRANAVQMDAAYSHRQQAYASMNAVQDLQSYGEVEQTNARNIALLLPPFQALYSALSPQQQKLADGIFVRHIDRAVRKNG